MNKVLTDDLVEKTSPPASGEIIYYDTQLKGFALCVTARTKLYIVEGKVNNQHVRVGIGLHGIYSTEKARLRAKYYLDLFDEGINPNEVIKEAYH